MGICGQTTNRKSDITLKEMANKFLCEINSESLGFFCIIPIKDNILKAIITNYNSEKIKIGNDLNICYNFNDKKTQTININEFRFICSDKNLNYTCIELLENDQIDNINPIDYKNNIPVLEENKKIVLYNDKINIVNGEIKKILNPKISISILNKNISPGSPIINREDGKIIGIFDKEEKGINIKEIINDIQKKRELFYINYIICKYDIKESNKNQEIQILNSFIQNQNEIEDNCIIFINEKKINFGYKYKFTNIGENEIIFFFKKPISNMKRLFYECIYLKKIDFTYFKSENVVNMSELFSKCESIESFNFTNFNTQNVKYMNWMFYECKNIIDIKLSFQTENVEDMSFMFQGCQKLENIDLSSFDTKNLIEMKSLFYDCINLKHINLSKFNTKKVIDMSAAFSNCSSLVNLDLSNFNTENVTKINWLFYQCSGLETLNIKNFNLKKVNENYDEIFYGINEKCKIECDDEKIKTISKV